MPARGEGVLLRVLQMSCPEGENGGETQHTVVDSPRALRVPTRVLFFSCHPARMYVRNWRSTFHFNRPLPPPPSPPCYAAGFSSSCMIVSMLFTHGGPLAKELSLRVPLAPEPGAHPTTLLHAVLRWLELATSNPGTAAADASSSGGGGGLAGGPAEEACALAVVRAAADAGVSLLRLLCGWLYGCPAAARELLENPANLYVVDVAAGRCALLQAPQASEGGKAAAGATAVQRVAVNGLACLMLGLLLEYVEGAGAPRSGGSSGEWTRALVMKMIQNRVGESLGPAGYMWKPGFMCVEVWPRGSRVGHSSPPRAEGSGCQT